MKSSPKNKSTGSSMMCDHANEVPAKCKCHKGCYCKSHTCKSNIKEMTHKELCDFEAESGFGGSGGSSHFRTNSKQKEVALEDLVTCVILTFLTEAKNLGWNGKKPIQKWYLGMDQKEMRAASDKLLLIMENPPKEET